MKTKSENNRISSGIRHSHFRLPALLIALGVLMAALSGCAIGGVQGTDSTFGSDTLREAQTDSPPDTIAMPPKIIFTPTTGESPGHYSGYTFRVLEHSGGADSLTSTGSDRIALVKEKTGAMVEVSASPTPIQTAESSMLSGATEYDALFLPLTDLSSLLRSGSLENLAELGLDPAAPGLDLSPAESLAVNGKYYIAFGDISPTSINSVYTLLCNIPAALSNEIHAIFGKDIREAALEGELTLEKLLRAYADAELIVSSTSTDTVLCLPENDNTIAPLSLLTAMGGEIFDISASSARLALEDTAFATAYEKAVKISSEAGSDGPAVFTVQKFVKTGEDRCCLPIPKADADSPYRCLADPEGTYGWSVLLGAESGKRTSEITCALFEFSGIAADEYFAEVTGSEQEAEIAGLIFSSRVLSVALLYDWGDFAQLTADGISRCQTLDGILNDSTFAKKAAAAAAAMEIFTERLS